MNNIKFIIFISQSSICSGFFMIKNILSTTTLFLKPVTMTYCFSEPNLHSQFQHLQPHLSHVFCSHFIHGCIFLASIAQLHKSLICHQRNLLNLLEILYKVNTGNNFSKKTPLCPQFFYLRLKCSSNYHITSSNYNYNIIDSCYYITLY